MKYINNLPKEFAIKTNNREDSERIGELNKLFIEEFVGYKANMNWNGSSNGYAYVWRNKIVKCINVYSGIPTYTIEEVIELCTIKGMEYEIY